jgi:hypothetical protein
MKTITVALALAALSTPALANQGPRPVQYAPTANYAPAEVGNAELCANVLGQYPSPHLRLLVQGSPWIRVDCGAHQSQSPVLVTFNNMTDLEYYRMHPGHRVAIQ